MPDGVSDGVPAADARALRRVRDKAERAAGPHLERARRASARLSRRFTSPLHHEWVASVLGVTLGVTFTVCFLTGLVDYFSQHPSHLFHLPARPLNLYRVTEGIHVVTGVASIPLLLAKLWAVWPQLFKWPPIRDVAHALERLSLVPLVGGSLFLLFTGVANIDYWYSPMPFFFPTAHFWAAWMVVGALIVHVGAKATQTRAALAQGSLPLQAVSAPPETTTADKAPGLSRRGFIGAVAASAGVLVISVAGETIAPLRRLAVLAPRNPTIGPLGIPVNQSAVEAGVTRSAVDPGYRLEVVGNCRRPRSFRLDELRALPQRQAGLPITCVEGWSAAASWRGVPLRSLLDRVGAPANVAVRVESLEASSRLYSSSVVDAPHVADPDTLLALELNDAPLDLDHGYPVRLIAPDRPGVLQTKWIAKVVVL